MAASDRQDRPGILSGAVMAMLAQATGAVTAALFGHSWTAGVLWVSVGIAVLVLLEIIVILLVSQNAF